MNVVLFENVIGENRPSMMRYPRELLTCMPANVKNFTRTAPALPFFRHYFYKELLYPFACARHQKNINHISDHSYAGLLRYIDPKKTVVTCHDLIPLQKTQESSFLGRKRFGFNVNMLTKAARIIAISNCTKAAILDSFDYPQEKIKVVYYGVSEDFKVMDKRNFYKKEYGLNSKTILQVGNSHPRKNVDIILKLLLKNKNITFIKVGSFAKHHCEYINKHNLQSRILQKNNIDSNIEMAKLYNIADVLLMPSFAEGFGWPILEAMACGIPVVCSDIGVFHELFDGAALFTNPYDISDLERKVNMIFNEQNLTRGLVDKGLKKAKDFSWEKCASQTYKVYKEVFDEKGS